MEPLQLFNMLNDSKEPFLPVNTQDVKIYCCGPTMYDAPNLGQVRTYVFMDVLRRILGNYLGYGIRLVMNVTDLDDKIISKGSIRVARHYETIFFQTMDLLNVERPDFAPRATDCLEVARNVSTRCLIEKIAYYEPGFETTYFSTEAYFKKFGCVFPHSPVESRENSGEGKWNPRDFVLWKSSKCWIDCEGKELKGLPGWDTECASMAMFYFPEYVDILLGMKDLQFTHHENEIALGCAYSNKRDFVRFCLCTDGVEIKEEKTFEELLSENYSPLAIRYMFLKHPYNKPMIFNNAELRKAQSSYDNFIYRINQMKLYLQKLKAKETKENFEEKWYDQYGTWAELNELNSLKKKIHDFLMDDVNVPKALEALENYVEMFSTEALIAMSYEWLRYCLNYILRITDSCFGLLEMEKFVRK